jgi:Ca-activated chloride channel family protein
MYDFVHYRDSRGMADSVQVDPVIDYDIVVNTIPPVIKRNVAIRIGMHTVVPVMAAQGTLIVQQEGRRDNNLQAIVRTSSQPAIINTQNSNASIRYLTGRYTVETLTLPRRTFDVEIQADKLRTILLPAPGVVNFNTIATGYGSLYEIKEDGTQAWVCDLNELRSQFSLTLLPGQYKVVFRVKQTKGSKYTAFKKFTLLSGKTMIINPFN